jgi:hypothetical protein
MACLREFSLQSDPIVFNPFGVRFGVRFIKPAQWEKWRLELPPLAGK